MTRADHFAFSVSDLDRSIRFYSETLGLKLLFRKLDEEHHEAFAFFELEGGNLELLQALDEANRPLVRAPKPVEPPYCPHFAIGVADLDAVVERLRERRIPLLKGPLEIPGSVRWLYIADPDNNVLEFVQWLDPSAASEG